MGKRLQLEIRGRLCKLEYEGRSLTHLCNSEFDILTVGELLNAAGFDCDEEKGKSVVVYIDEVD